MKHFAAHRAHGAVRERGALALCQPVLGGNRYDIGA